MPAPPPVATCTVAARARSMVPSRAGFWANQPLAASRGARGAAAGTLTFYRDTTRMAERFTEKQGQHLAYVYNYTVIFGRPPAQADLQRFFRTTPPTIHQMLLTLADRQLISRTAGQARSIKVLVDPDEIPRLVPTKEREI